MGKKVKGSRMTPKYLCTMDDGTINQESGTWMNNRHGVYQCIWLQAMEINFSSLCSFVFP